VTAERASLGGFVEGAKSLSTSPLGIIALFIVLLYAFASLVTAFGSSFTQTERMPLIYFLVFFPVIVLAVFGWLVSQHPTSLYAPKDFRDEQNFVRTAALIAAATFKSDAAGPRAIDINAILQTVDAQYHARQGRDTSRRLLWVDDRPENNVLEREAFESAGFEITLALSTTQALQATQGTNFAAIISDMGRKEGPREGYNLLETLRSQGNATPFFVYAGANLPEHQQEALARGAQGSTNDPNELFRLVTSVTF
jgi:CheY-like chemotaxis protein